jgi:hypothetical protein
VKDATPIFYLLSSQRRCRLLSNEFVRAKSQSEVMLEICLSELLNRTKSYRFSMTTISLEAYEANSGRRPRKLSPISSFSAASITYDFSITKCWKVLARKEVILNRFLWQESGEISVRFIITVLPITLGT